MAAVVMVITGCKTGPPGRYSPRALPVTRGSQADQPSVASASLNVADGRITAAAFSGSGRK